MPLEVLKRDAAAQLRIDFADVRFDNFQVELFRQRVGDMAFLDSPQLDQYFAYSLSPRSIRALELEGFSNIAFRYQMPGHQNLADFHLAAMPFQKFVEPGSADPVHLDQHISKAPLALHVLGNLACLQ